MKLAYDPDLNNSGLHNFSASWVCEAGQEKFFKYPGPWWHRLGKTGDGQMLVAMFAAITAENERAVKAIVVQNLLKGAKIMQWNNPVLRLPGWSPFSEAFPRGEWMQWPFIQDPEYGDIP